nr:hypothetical protein [Tanacetum cinerariifolium]
YHLLHPSGTPPLLPIPLSTPSTSRRARILETDTPPRNRPLLATARPGCEVEESSAAAVRRPGPTMAHEVDCSCVESRLQDTERRMMAALELVNMRVSYQCWRLIRVASSGIVRLQMILLFSILCVPRLWRLEHAMTPWRTQTPPPTNPNNMNPKTVQTMIDQALLRNSGGKDGSHSSHAENLRNMHTAHPCYYADFIKCHPLNFKGTEGVVGLTRWIVKMESVFNISGRAVENQYCPLGEVNKLVIKLWNLKVRDNDIPAYTNRFQKLALICTKFISNETEKVDKYISGFPDNIYRNVKSSKPKTLDETIELANDLMDQKLR